MFYKSNIRNTANHYYLALILNCSKSISLLVKITNIPVKIRWIKNVPCSIKEGAINDLVRSYSQRFRNFKETGIFKHPSFKSKRKTITETFCIPTQNFSKKQNERWRFFVSTFPGTLKIRKKDRRLLDQYPDGPVREVKITRHRTNVYHMKIPVYLRKLEIPEENRGHLVSQDPGSNPFMTYYSPTRMICGSFGIQKDLDRLHELERRSDYIKSKRNVTTRKEKKKFRKSHLRLTRKITNLGLECARKVINYMINNYQYIHASIYEVSKMLQKKPKGKNRVNSTTRRDQSAWQHYSYKRLLSEKMELIKGLVVEFSDEAYTTKQCDSCGCIQNVNGKLFKCVKCCYTVNRDVHGARGHALKNCVGKYKWL